MGKIFAIGGEATRHVERLYNQRSLRPDDESWSSMRALPEGRHGTGAAVMDDAHLHSGRRARAGRQSPEQHAVDLSLENAAYHKGSRLSAADADSRRLLARAALRRAVSA